MPTSRNKKKLKQPNFTFQGTRKRKIKQPKVSRRMEISTRAEINETETKKAIEKVNETNSWFSEKRNKTDKPLARLTKKKKRELNT